VPATGCTGAGVACLRTASIIVIMSWPEAVVESTAAVFVYVWHTCQYLPSTCLHGRVLLGRHVQQGLPRSYDTACCWLGGASWGDVTVAGQSRWCQARQGPVSVIWTINLLKDLGAAEPQGDAAGRGGSNTPAIQHTGVPCSVLVNVEVQQPWGCLFVRGGGAPQ
jgi:hypothetical protein